MAEDKFEAVDGGAGVMEELRGHSSIVIEDADGTEYTLRYTRKTVKEMEARGVTAKSVAETVGEGTLTGMLAFLSDFVMPAFKADQPKVTLEKVIEVYEQLPDKARFIELLMGLFMQPTLALTTDPTETRAKFRLV